MQLCHSTDCIDTTLIPTGKRLTGIRAWMLAQNFENIVGNALVAISLFGGFCVLAFNTAQATRNDVYISYTQTYISY